MFHNGADQNGDGVLTREEIEEFILAFDENGDEHLTDTELTDFQDAAGAGVRFGSSGDCGEGGHGGEGYEEPSERGLKAGFDNGLKTGHNK